MKKFSLMAVASGLLAVSAAAQTSQVSGYTVLVALGNARGVRPPLTVATLQNLKPGSAAYRATMEKLRVSPGAFAGLLAHGNKAAPTVLATRAVLEAATGKTLTDAAVAALIRQNPSVAVTTLEKLSALVNNPAAAVLANVAADLANQPVTPRGGGN